MSTTTALRPRRSRPALLRAAALALVALAAGPAAADQPPAAPASQAPPAATAAPPAGTASTGPVTHLNTTAPLATSPPPIAPLSPPGAPFAPPRLGPAPAWTAPPTPEAVAQFKRKKQLIIAGSILFGLAYYGALAASSAGISRGGSNSREYIGGLFPIVGPFVTAGLRADPSQTRFANQPPPVGDFTGMSAYLAFGVVQSLGAGLFIAGLRMPTGRAPAPCSEPTWSRRPCPPARLSFQPVVSPTFAGGGLTGVF